MPRYIDVEGLNLYDDLFMSEDTINKSGVYVRYRAVEDLIKNAPTADVQEVKHAHWYQQEELLGWQEVDCAICSACGESYVLNEDLDMDYWREMARYCPNCGAKMDEEENEK